MIGTSWASCKGCRAQRQIAGDVPGRPFLSFFFVLIDCAELFGAGWTRDAGAWWCRHCTRRRNLMRPILGGKRPLDVAPARASNVTDPAPPSGEKM